MGKKHKRTAEQVAKRLKEWRRALVDLREMQRKVPGVADDLDDRAKRLRKMLVEKIPGQVVEAERMIAYLQIELRGFSERERLQKRVRSGRGRIQRLERELRDHARQEREGGDGNG